MIGVSPFGEGWLAFRHGLSILDCPYTDELDEAEFKDGLYVLAADRWRAGWKESQT
jgi:hypothetical protein